MQKRKAYTPEYKAKLVEKPICTAFDSDEPYTVQADATLIPDLVSIYRSDNEFQFVIFDAKYYSMQLSNGKPLKGQPGVESIAKQYLYQLAFHHFVTDHGFTAVKNCFLLPTEQDDIIIKGIAAMSILSGLGLQDIQIRYLPACVAYDYYIKGIRFDIGLLKL